MAQTFEDRVEEVLGTLHGMAWPLLEESDKRRIVGKVVKGIDKGDTVSAWARALGMPDATLRARIERFRRSEPLDDRARMKENERIRRAHARSVLRDPAAVVEVIENLKPSEREAVFDAAAASLTRSGPIPRAEVPELDQWSAAGQTMALIDRQTRHLADQIDRTRMSEHRDAELEEWVGEHIARIRRLRTKEGRADLRLVMGG